MHPFIMTTAMKQAETPVMPKRWAIKTTIYPRIVSFHLILFIYLSLEIGKSDHEISGAGGNLISAVNQASRM